MTHAQIAERKRLYSMIRALPDEKAARLVCFAAALEAEEPPLTETKHRRIGFMKDQIKVPDDFDRMGEDVVAEMFEAPLVMRSAPSSRKNLVVDLNQV